MQGSLEEGSTDSSSARPEILNSGLTRPLSGDQVYQPGRSIAYRIVELSNMYLGRQRACVKFRTRKETDPERLATRRPACMGPQPRRRLQRAEHHWPALRLKHFSGMSIEKSAQRWPRRSHRRIPRRKTGTRCMLSFYRRLDLPSNAQSYSPRQIREGPHMPRQGVVARRRYTCGS